MAKRNNTALAIDDGKTVSAFVSLFDILTPRDGETIAEQFSALSDYIVGKAGKRYPSLIAPKGPRAGDVLDEFGAAILNSQYTARARASAKDEPSIETAFIKACAWVPTQDDWSALDELADRFVRRLMLSHARRKLGDPNWKPSEKSEASFYGTREDREPNRTVLLTQPSRAVKFGSEFGEFVLAECTQDLGESAAPVSSGGSGRKSTKLDLSLDDDE